MKLDLQENMYVRTKYGNIAKIININDYREPSLKYGIEASYLKDVMFIGDEDIIKASFNIIDLVEVGDYVNGREVVDIFYIGIDNVMDVCVLGSIVYSNDEIESIVTHQQFEQISYKLGE